MCEDPAHARPRLVTGLRPDRPPGGRGGRPDAARLPVARPDVRGVAARRHAQPRAVRPARALRAGGRRGVLPGRPLRRRQGSHLRRGPLRRGARPPGPRRRPHRSRGVEAVPPAGPPVPGDLHRGRPRGPGRGAADLPHERPAAGSATAHALPEEEVRGAVPRPVAHEVLGPQGGRPHRRGAAGGGQRARAPPRLLRARHVQGRVLAPGRQRVPPVRFPARDGRGQLPPEAHRLAGQRVHQHHHEHRPLQEGGATGTCAR